MAEPTVAALMADIVATLQTEMGTDLGGRVTYPPTDGPPQALVILLDYGPVIATASQFEEALHTVVANVMAPLKGWGYPMAYEHVTAAAQRVRWAMRQHPVVADEAVVMSVIQDRARAGTYAQAEVVAATVTWTLETKDEFIAE